jgi:hypothetical protein
MQTTWFRPHLAQDISPFDFCTIFVLLGEATTHCGQTEMTLFIKNKKVYFSYVGCLLKKIQSLLAKLH